VKGEQLYSTSVNSPFTYRNMAKDTDIKGYESIDVHGVRNNIYKIAITTRIIIITLVTIKNNNTNYKHYRKNNHINHRYHK
jgi:hypothetical protein